MRSKDPMIPTENPAFEFSPPDRGLEGVAVIFGRPGPRENFLRRIRWRN